MPSIGLLSQAVKKVPSFAEGLAEAAKSKTVSNAVKGNPAEAFAVKPWEQGKVHTYLAGHAKSGALIDWLLMNQQKQAGFFDASTHAALGSMTPEEQQALAQRFEEDPHALREIGHSARLGSTMGGLGGAGIGGLAGFGAGEIAHAGLSGLLGRFMERPPYEPKMWPGLLGALLLGAGGAAIGSRLGKDEERSKALLRENALANEESEVRKLLSQYYQSVRQGEPASGEPDEADARYASVKSSEESIIEKKLAPYRDKKEFPAPEEHEGVPRFQDPREDVEKTSAAREALQQLFLNGYSKTAAGNVGMLRTGVNAFKGLFRSPMAVGEARGAVAQARNVAQLMWKANPQQGKGLSNPARSVPKKTVETSTGTPPVGVDTKPTSSPTAAPVDEGKKKKYTYDIGAVQKTFDQGKAQGGKPATAQQVLEQYRKSQTPAGETPVKGFWNPTRKLLAGVGAVGGGAYLLNRATAPQPSQQAQYAPQGYPQGYAPY